MRIKDINLEEFNKLPQLDRIEFRQKRDYLETKRVFLRPMSFFSNWIIMLTLFFSLGLLLLYIALPSTISLLISYISLIPFLFKIGLGIFIILIIFQLYFIKKENKREEELVNEYFKEIKSIKRKIVVRKR